jgi:hypothetical protein
MVLILKLGMTRCMALDIAPDGYDILLVGSVCFLVVVVVADHGYNRLRA